MLFGMSANLKKIPTHLTLRLSPAEYQRLKDAAAGCGMSLSDYGRLRLFGGDDTKIRTRGKRPVKDYEALGKVLAALGHSRIASNLNQLARSANAGNFQLTPETNLLIMDSYAAIRSMKAQLMIALAVDDEAA
jgi:hypothetical protein